MRSSDNLSMIHAVTEAATSVLEGLSLPRTLQRIADIARDITNARYAALGIPTDDKEGLQQFITSGISAETAKQVEHEPKGRGLLGALFETDEPIRLDNLQDDPRSAGFCGNHPIMTTFLGVPIIGRNKQRVGNLYLCDRIDGQPFDEIDENLVQLFAWFAAIAIENAKLHQKLQVAALRSERDRISMELHDGVIQEIYAIGMKLEIARGMAQFSPEAEKHFQTILQDLNRIIDDIRLYIRDLSNADRAQASTFQQQIENLVTHFRDFSGIPVDLDVTDKLQTLTDNQRHSLAQIVRESLANIARHAQATHASVTIHLEKNQIHLTISDNGIGLSLEEDRSAEHFGLRNMQERARRLRGFLEIESQPNQGTTIRVVVPMKQSGLLGR